MNAKRDLSLVNLCLLTLLASGVGCGAEEKAAPAASKPKMVGYDLRMLRPGEQKLGEQFDAMHKASLGEGKQVAVLFSADWCAPCKAAKKAILENVALKRIVDSYDVVQYNFDIATPMRKKYKVDRVPTFIVVADGEEIRRQLGFGGSEKLIDFLD